LNAFSAFLAYKKAIWKENIICLLNVLKCDFGDVDEAMFHDVERSFERIFYNLGLQKSDFGEEA
jgi:hypothetical protein